MTAGDAVAEIVHMIADGEAVTSCCGRTPFELPRSERLTVDPALAGGCVRDLGAWLTQIWDQDEARLSHVTFCGPVWPTTEQLLARIAADRLILARYESACVRADDLSEIEQVREEWGVIASTYEGVLCVLASALKERPGYREEWRP